LDGKTETNNYAYNSVKEAIDIIRDPEFVPYNLVSVPGITNEQLTTHLINTAEARADALAVIDLKGDFQPSHEDDKGKQYPNLSDTITNLKNRQINSSYGCAYYPFVQIRDTLQGQLVYMPASEHHGLHPQDSTVVDFQAALLVYLLLTSHRNLQRKIETFYTTPTLTQLLHSQMRVL
jgi:hypothetical protein